ncbi:hypothetical protein [Pelagibacterium sp.]|uniref:hypothetical protein n=1 Tax=Pelagibacterium sp. TaxID=1967288 RepID=UPI003BAA7F5A
MDSDTAMLLDIAFLDDSTRPRAPKLENLTASQRAPGQHLKMIHDHLRENVKVLRTMIDQVMAGEKRSKRSRRRQKP